jgi:ankyrin repeat protein
MDQELFEAARVNNLSEVRRLFSVGADVNAKFSNGWTTLIVASLNGHLPVVKELLEHGADIEATTIFGSTALHLAGSRGHVAVVNELMSPNDSNGATTTALGKRKSRGGANIEAKDRFGVTPLHEAAAMGHLPVVKALVCGGADILATNDKGHIPIHFAVSYGFYGHSAVIKYLLQHIYAPTRRLPLHELLKDLTWMGDPNISDGVPPLRKALHRNMLGTDDVVEILAYLVERNPEWISARDQDGSLPLHVACRRGASFPIVQFLVNCNGASVKSVTPQGDFPLFLACETPETSLETIFLLIKLYPDLVYQCEIYRTDSSWGGCSLL